MDQLASVDLGAMILSFARYVNRVNDSQGVGVRIKIKLCQLIETFMSKKDFLSIRQEIKVRNKLVEILTEWTSFFASVREALFLS